MLQCQSAMAGAALLRLRLLYQMLRVGELVALVALVSWLSLYVPSAVAAVVRLAGSLLLNARFVFVLGNAIVLLLFALSRHEHDLSSSSATSSGDNRQPVAVSPAATAPQQAAPVPSPAADSAGFASFTTPVPASDAMTTTTTASFTTPPAAVVPAPEPRAALLEETKQPAVAARVVNKQARAPRRSRSEKMGPRLSSRRAASPELRRCESENGRGRRRSSVTARDAEACWGREDADEFRRQVEAFIARQTRFHREESMLLTTAGHCEAAPAITGALAVVE